MTWYEEAKKRDPLESAKKYIKLTNEEFDMDDDDLMTELDILWMSACQDKESRKIILFPDSKDNQNLNNY
jgi:hypothetical protein